MAFKVFSNGDALNASELNTFLMNQSVITFASATARDAAIPAPVEGQLVWLNDVDRYTYYTGSAWTNLIVPAGDAAGKNKIINGAFDIWQRGTSFVPTAAAWTYNADRWDSGRASGTSGTTITRQSSGLTGFQYALRFQRNNGDTNTGAQYLVQRLDTATSLPLAGQTVTLSWYARAGANYSPASSGLQLFVYSGTGTDQGGFPSAWTSSSTIVNGTTSTLTTSWQRFTSTFAVGSAATQVGFLFQYTGVGTAGAADYYDITGVQLEIGSSATSFARAAATLQGELAACQRYYQKSYNLDVAPQTNSSASGLQTNQQGNWASNAYGCFVPFLGAMRATPTVTVYSFTSSTAARVSDGVGTDLAANSGIANLNGNRGFTIQNQSGGTLTAAQGGFVFHWIAQAEL